MTKARRASTTIAINIALTIILFLVLEGLSSIILHANDAFLSNLVSERRHTQYDDELGWINLPNLYLKDMYGPGKSFKTNSITLRSDKEFTSNVPVNKVRFMCSGDSFTMGYGVDNDAVWCHRFESIDDRIESVNLGQGGYGVDQAYLWFKRNSSKLDYDVELFAFITDDFDRMQSDTFLGFGKPLLVLQNGLIANKNKPVPKVAYRFPRLPLIRDACGRLSVVKLLRKLLDRAGAHQENKDQKDSDTRQVVVRLFDDLQEINKAKGSVVVFVYLPAESDYLGTQSDSWRKFLHERTSQSSQQPFIFIDLVDEIRKIPSQDLEALYNQIQDHHYSEKGNQYVADLLYRKLLAIPEIAAKFHRTTDR